MKIYDLLTFYSLFNARNSTTDNNNNIQKIPGDLRRFAVIQDTSEKPPTSASVKNSQMTK